MTNEILVVGNKSEAKLLRKKTVDFDFKKFTKKEVNELVIRMRRAMKAANGVGLSANQVGLRYRMFVAEVPDAQGAMKFYAVFNPKIERASERNRAVRGRMLERPWRLGRRHATGKDRIKRV